MLVDWPLMGRDRELAEILEGVERGVGALVVGAPGSGKSTLVREVRRRLSTHDEFGSDVVFVDDVDRLDDDDADLVWRAALNGATTVASARADGRFTEPVDRLWTSGVCRRIDLEPLGADDVRAVLEQLLGGDVEDHLPRVVAHRSSGNALLTRELIHAGLDSGAIVERAGVWCLVDDLPLGISLTARVREDLAHLGSEHDAAELLAIGEPLSLEVAERAVGAEPLEALEARGLITVDTDADTTWVRFAHPLAGDVMRDDVATLRRRRRLRELVAAIGATSSATTSERFRALDWRLELGEPIDSDALLRAARAARGMASASAERLALALVAQNPTFQAHVVLAETLILRGRVAEASAILDAIDRSDLEPTDVEVLLRTRSLARLQLGETLDAATMLAAEPGAAIPFELQAAHAHALSLEGRIADARVIAFPVITDPRADDTQRALAACSVLAGNAMEGRFDEGERVFAETRTTIARAQPALPYALAISEVATTIAVHMRAGSTKPTCSPPPCTSARLRDGDDWSLPRGASGLGTVALLRGQPRTATRSFRIAVASLNAFDEMYRRYTLAWLARAAALAGLVDEAEAALDDAHGAPELAIFRPDWCQAEAAVLARADRWSPPAPVHSKPRSWRPRTVSGRSRSRRHATPCATPEIGLPPGSPSLPPPGSTGASPRSSPTMLERASMATDVCSSPPACGSRLWARSCSPPTARTQPRTPSVVIATAPPPPVPSYVPRVCTTSVSRLPSRGCRVASRPPRSRAASTRSPCSPPPDGPMPASPTSSGSPCAPCRTTSRPCTASSASAVVVTCPMPSSVADPSTGSLAAHRPTPPHCGHARGRCR